MPYKHVIVELTVKASVLVKIEECKGDNDTPASVSVELSDWDRKGVEEQLDKYVEDNQQEIMEE